MSHNQKSPETTPELAADGVEAAMRVIEGKWKMIIIFHLFAKGVLRFSVLERAIPGITQKMLIQQLRELERDGVVARTVYPEVPPKVEYGLTDLGKELCPALDELLVWAQKRQKARHSAAKTANVNADSAKTQPKPKAKPPTKK